MEVPLAVDLGGIPGELKALAHWVVWSWPDKAPRHPATGRPTDATDRAAWMTFDRVCAVRDRFDGIGFAIGGSGLVGIDLDKCVDESGAVAEWASAIVRRLDSYAEITPSGTGLRVWVRGQLPPGRRRKGPIEMYDSHRYFTVTGHHLDGTPTEIRERGEVLAALHAEIFPETTTPPPADRPRPAANPDDDTILDRMFRSKNGAQIEALFRGDRSGYGSESEADLALCSHLAFATGGDVDAIDRLFRRSAIRRRKWDSRPDYRERTIARALVGTRFYDPNYNNNKDTNEAILPFLRFLPGVGSEEWEAPEWPKIDSAHPFPLDVMPARFRELCLAAAATFRAPVDYFAAVGLAAAAGVIGRSVVLKVSRTWEVTCNLFLAILGDPGSRKSPALKLMGQALARIDWELHQQWLEARQEWEAQDPKVRGPGPVHPHLKLDDSTREAVARHLHENPRGLIYWKDELTSWVSSWNVYRQGKGDDQQFWMSLNTGAPIKVTRKGSIEPIVVPFPAVSVVGCLPPKVLSRMRPSRDDDGWIDRLLFSYPDPVAEVPTWDRAEIPQDLIDDWEAAIRRLWGWAMVVDDLEGRPRPTYIHLDAQAEEAWARFYDEHHAEQHRGDFPDALRGPWSKLEGFTLRLALILARLHQVYDPERCRLRPADVGALDIWGAGKLAAYFKAHFRRARTLLHGQASGPGADACRVLDWIRADRLTQFTAFEVLRRFRNFDKQDRDRALEELVRHHHIRFRAKVRAGGKRGRSREVYEVNPDTLTQACRTGGNWRKGDPSGRIVGDEPENETKKTGLDRENETNATNCAQPGTNGAFRVTPDPNPREETEEREDSSPADPVPSVTAGVSEAELSDAVQWLTGFLPGKKRDAAEVFREAEACGISDAAIRAAAGFLKVERIFTVGEGGEVWELN